MTLENSLAVSYKTKDEITLQPTNYTLGNLYQSNENSHSLMNLNIYLHKSFIQSSPELEKNPDLFNGSKMKKNMVYLLAEPPEKSKNTGVGSLSLLQGVFLTQELNQGLLH